MIYIFLIDGGDILIYENEITVEVNCNLNELNTILNRENFKVICEYEVKDIYMIEKNYINFNDKLEMLKHCVLIRNIIDENDLKILTYKYKEYDDNGDIKKQGKVSCEIDSIEKMEEILKMVNFDDLIRIEDHVVVYSNGVDELAVEFVNDKHIYIEIEQNNKYLSIDEMKAVFSKYNIPVKGKDFFVKKALIELKERYGD